jgi:uncharacterized protein
VGKLQESIGPVGVYFLSVKIPEILIMNHKRMIFLFYAKIFFLGAILSFGFIVLDGIWLSLLPRLQISFGEISGSLVGFIFLRACLFILWLILFVVFAIFRTQAMGLNAIWILAAFNLFLLGLGIYGYFVEPMELSVGRIEVAVPGLSHPVRIIQLSDIHVERNTRRELALPGLVAGLHPDLIVITGDYLNESYTHDRLSARDLREILGQMDAPLGIYAVNGNVETPEEMDVYLKGMNIRPLENEVIRIPALGDHFVILGLNYVDVLTDQIELNRLMKQVRPGDYSLLLYHKPDLAYAARDLRINLYLAGHTHGGQVRLPFYGALFANSRYGKTFEMGLYHLDQMTMYVSRGLGMAGGGGPRIRFLCPPEVVVIDLVPGSTPDVP